MYLYPHWPHTGTCPSCGHCPCCGRSKGSSYPFTWNNPGAAPLTTGTSAAPLTFGGYRLDELYQKLADMERPKASMSAEAA